jgi:hypothetical protein
VIGDVVDVLVTQHDEMRRLCAAIRRPSCPRVVSAPLLGLRGNTRTIRNFSCGGRWSLPMRTSVISGDQRNWFARYTRRWAERRARR